MKILILEANPRSDLSLNEEIRELEEVIQRSRDRHQFEIRIKLAVRSSDLQPSILDFKPNIIHFCGHGAGEEGLVLRDKKISTDALSTLFSLSKEHLQCVVLNACYSDTQANEIVKNIDYVIGMKQAIQDNAAIAFSIGFYLALGYGRTYEDAFKFGRNAIQLQIVNKSISSNQIAEETRKLIPMNLAPEITITEEHLKPTILKNKTNSMTSEQRFYCNLPPCDYPKFIGREQELQQLLQQISPNCRQYIATVEGIGGVGKTALVLEAANLCWEAKQNQINADVEIPIFDAIIFTSAKKTYLTSRGILNRPRFEETLQEIFRTIANVLNEPSISMAQEVTEQLRLVYESLSKQKTILMIDNMETISQKEEEKIIDFLADLPKSTKAIITSRERIGMYRSIRISALSRTDSLKLINQEAKNKGIKITDYQAERFFRVFGGIPVALIYAVGQRHMGYSLKKILGLREKKQLPDDLARFLFTRSVEPLRGQAAHQLLMSMTFFQTSPNLDALVAVAGLQEEPNDVEEGLPKLQQLSLLSEENRLYSILPITHRYALEELTKHPGFLAEARNRWVQWYLTFTQRHGGRDWQYWRVQYDHLAQEWENIASVLYWCAAQDRYDEVKQIWQNIDRYVDLGCYWRTRRHWWGWLIKQSDQRADLPTYVRALSERAWTLTLMGDDEAERELDKAWKMRDYVELDVQAHLANHIAVHRITQKKYDEALEWLQQQEQLVNEANLEQREHIRHQACISYYQAEIAYWKWKTTANQADYQRAKQLFQQVFDQGKEIGWQRFTNYAQNWLAEIFIIENDLNQAEKLLKEGLLIAQKSREKRRIGHYLASYARLEVKRPDYEKAKEYAEVAIDIFDKEGIKEDAQKMRDLIDLLRNNRKNR
jgi:hypothetical protein